MVNDAMADIYDKYRQQFQMQEVKPNGSDTEGKGDDRAQPEKIEMQERGLHGQLDRLTKDFDTTCRPSNRTQNRPNSALTAMSYTLGQKVFSNKAETRYYSRSEGPQALAPTLADVKNQSFGQDQYMQLKIGLLQNRLFIGNTKVFIIVLDLYFDSMVVAGGDLPILTTLTDPDHCPLQQQLIVLLL
uniref:Uncharacterized protein n=1 Tax=Romanomermis culicivorax TaxID=13658 RepID=A0A915KUD5_ROMCU